MSKFRDAIFTLASRINDFHKTHTIVHYQLFSVGVLYRGVVSLQTIESDNMSLFIEKCDTPLSMRWDKS